MINIIYMGTPDYAAVILESLIKDKDINILCSFTQPDKIVGRKKILNAPPVKKVSLEHGINVFQPVSLRSNEVQEKIKSLKADFIVVAAYGQILPKEVLEASTCINLHASILPKYRGASPIQQALINGDKKTGVTAMLMDIGLDTGDILKISEVDIDKDMMVEELFEKLSYRAAELTLEVLKNFDSLKPVKQNSDEATYCPKITKENGLVTFDDAEKLYNLYRAYSTWPGIYLSSGLKLKKLRIDSFDGQHRAGEILKIQKDEIIVGCKSGAVGISRVQPPSKKEMDIKSYLNGKRLECADTLV